MHWTLRPRRPPVHVTRSARARSAAPRGRCKPDRGRAAAHNQITKRYKAFWMRIALEYTGTLQYRFWRADCAQPGDSAPDSDAWVHWLNLTLMSPPSPPPHEFRMQE